MSDPIVDQTMPEGRWTFDADVTAAFDDMLVRSIPQYEVMRQSVTDLAMDYAKDRTDIVDLGCSRGEAIAPLLSKLGAYNRFVGIEVAESMLEACRNRFAGFIERGIVDVRSMDLRLAYPSVKASVTLGILTIQFVPIEHRLRLLRDIWKHTIDGGAFILVEKILGQTADLDALFVDRYYALKSNNGYCQEAIERKRLSLEGVLVPVTARWNEEMLVSAGFKEIDCFWRWMNFAGWIAIK